MRCVLNGYNFFIIIFITRTVALVSAAAAGSSGGGLCFREHPILTIPCAFRLRRVAQIHIHHLRVGVQEGSERERDPVPEKRYLEWQPQRVLVLSRRLRLWLLL